MDFESILPKHCIEQLQGVGETQKKDSIFISIVLNALYSDTNTLKQKSLSGRSKNGNKAVLTPEKKSILNSINAQRMKYLLPTEAIARKDNLPSILRKAIDTVNRKKTL